MKLFDDSFDLVVTDMVMPEVSGVEFIQKIRGQSKVKIVATSGYGIFSPTPFEPSSVKLNIDASYTKGGPVEELVEVIKKLLAAPPSEQGPKE